MWDTFVFVVKNTCKACWILNRNMSFPIIIQVYHILPIEIFITVA